MTLRLREVAGVARAATNHRRPLLVHLIVTRRCNLFCAYCNEYDRSSAPVPTALLRRRIDALAALDTVAVTFTGGEPLLHPELDALVRHARERGMIAGLITNGYLLEPQRVRALNRAGLDHLQISIDNIEPDAVSKKSLRLLDPKLRALAAEAQFHVNVNTVVGADVDRAEDALVIARRARQLGLSTTVGLIHDGAGQLERLGARERAVLETLLDQPQSSYGRLGRRWRRALAHGEHVAWRCRAGARYLYVCEDGLVHYCSQQRGRPGIPLDRYGAAEIERAYGAVKPCEPGCTISCAFAASALDRWRAPQHLSP